MPDVATLGMLRAFTVVYEPEIVARAQAIVQARRVIVGDAGEAFGRTSADGAELTDAAIGSCAAALVDVLVSRALMAGAFGSSSSERRGPR